MDVPQRALLFAYRKPAFLINCLVVGSLLRQYRNRMRQKNRTCFVRKNAERFFSSCKSSPFTMPLVLKSLPESFRD